MTSERIREGVARLLAAPSDLAQCGARLGGHPTLANASEPHRLIFLEYEGHLKLAALAAMDWWNKTVEARLQAASNRQGVVHAAWRSRPAGPASFPGFVALIRDYWLKCDALNENCRDDQRVSPETMLLAWLLDDRHSLEVQVISCMPYWPIGLSREGKWL
jgi:hypothetical protein